MAPPTQRSIAYERVSTARQGASGLGLEAQSNTIDAYAALRGTDALARFTEVESGRKSDRPELTRAIHLAKVTGATLIIAKLDRLSPNAAFLLTLRDSGICFLACDMPEANDLTVGVMALVAQQEREAISRRTKLALAVAKARGVRLGPALRRAGKGGAAMRAAVARNANDYEASRRADVEGLLALFEESHFRFERCNSCIPVGKCLRHIRSFEPLWDMLRAVGVPCRDGEQDDLFGTCAVGFGHQVKREFRVALDNAGGAPNLDAPTMDVVDQEQVCLGVFRKVAAGDELAVPDKIDKSDGVVVNDLQEARWPAAVLDVRLTVSIRRRHKDAGLGFYKSFQVIADVCLPAARLFLACIGSARAFAGLYGLYRFGEGDVTAVVHMSPDQSPRSLSPGWSVGRAPLVQRNLRSSSEMARSLMEA